MMNVKFNASQHLSGKKLSFFLLTKYLILNEVTGAVKLFRFQLDGGQEEMFYPRIPKDKIVFK